MLREVNKPGGGIMNRYGDNSSGTLGNAVLGLGDRHHHSGDRGEGGNNTDRDRIFIPPPV